MSLLCSVERDISTVLLCHAEDLLKYSYGCVMVMIDPQSEVGQQLRALRDEIPDEDLMAKGREEEPHVTVRYGIVDTASEAGVAAYLTEQAPFTITLGKTIVFPATTQSDNAAVVVVQVESPDLERINDELAAAGEFKPADFDYHPHITLAYVKPEAADKWDGEDSVEGLEPQVNEIVIASKDGARTPIALAGPVEKIAKFNPNHAPASGEFTSGDFVTAAQTFRENPGESGARRQLTILAGHTKEGGSYAHLHPGAITVYRAGLVGSKGTSFSKSLAQAKKQLEIGKSKIYALALTKDDPAIDINKLDPNSRYSHEREVFVDTRGLDRSRIETIEQAEKIAPGGARFTCPTCGKFVQAHGQTCATCAPSPTEGIESTPDEPSPVSNDPGTLPAPDSIGIKQTDDPLGESPESPESGGGAVGVSGKDNALAEAADRSENPYGTGTAKVLLCGIEKFNANHDEHGLFTNKPKRAKRSKGEKKGQPGAVPLLLCAVEDDDEDELGDPGALPEEGTTEEDDEALEKFNELHDFQGRFDFNFNTKHATGLTLKPSKKRAYNGEQVALKEKWSKHSTDRLGENILIAHLQKIGKKDARPITFARNHYPLDLVQNHEVIELKTGLVSVHPNSRQWRIMIGQGSPAEEKLLASLSAADKTARNADKMAKIMQAKQDAAKEVQVALKSKTPLVQTTYTITLNPETKTADIYKFAGYHKRLGWNSDLAKNSYVTSYNY